MYKEWIGMAIGRVLDETPLSHSHPKIYNYFPSPPKPRARWGMHSHPNFETTIKIPSAPCLDPGMLFWSNEIRNQRTSWISQRNLEQTNQYSRKIPKVQDRKSKNKWTKNHTGSWMREDMLWREKMVVMWTNETTNRFDYVIGMDYQMDFCAEWEEWQL